MLSCCQQVRSYEDQWTEEEFEKLCQADSPGSPKLDEALKGTPSTKDSSLPKVDEQEGPQLPLREMQPPSVEQLSLPSDPVSLPKEPQSTVKENSTPVKRGRGRPKRAATDTSLPLLPSHESSELMINQENDSQSATLSSSATIGDLRPSKVESGTTKNKLTGTTSVSVSTPEPASNIHAKGPGRKTQTGEASRGRTKKPSVSGSAAPHGRTKLNKSSSDSTASNVSHEVNPILGLQKGPELSNVQDSAVQKTEELFKGQSQKLSVALGKDESIMSPASEKIETIKETLVGCKESCLSSTGSVPTVVESAGEQESKPPVLKDDKGKTLSMGSAEMTPNEKSKADNSHKTKNVEVLASGEKVRNQDTRLLTRTPEAKPGSKENETAVPMTASDFTACSLTEKDIIPPTSVRRGPEKKNSVTSKKAAAREAKNMGSSAHAVRRSYAQPSGSSLTDGKERNSKSLRPKITSDDDAKHGGIITPRSLGKRNPGDLSTLPSQKENSTGNSVITQSNQKQEPDGNGNESSSKSASGKTIPVDDAKNGRTITSTLACTSEEINSNDCIPIASSPHKGKTENSEISAQVHQQQKPSTSGGDSSYAAIVSSITEKEDLKYLEKDVHGSDFKATESGLQSGASLDNVDSLQAKLDTEGFRDQSLLSSLADDLPIVKGSPEHAPSESEGGHRASENVNDPINVTDDVQVRPHVSKISREGTSSESSVSLSAELTTPSIHKQSKDCEENITKQPADQLTIPSAVHSSVEAGSGESDEPSATAAMISADSVSMGDASKFEKDMVVDGARGPLITGAVGESVDFAGPSKNIPALDCFTTEEHRVTSSSNFMDTKETRACTDAKRETAGGMLAATPLAFSGTSVPAESHKAMADETGTDPKCDQECVVSNLCSQVPDLTIGEAGSAEEGCSKEVLPQPTESRSSPGGNAASQASLSEPEAIYSRDDDIVSAVDDMSATSESIINTVKDTECAAEHINTASIANLGTDVGSASSAIPRDQKTGEVIELAKVPSQELRSGSSSFVASVDSKIQNATNVWECQERSGDFIVAPQLAQVHEEVEGLNERAKDGISISLSDNTSAPSDIPVETENSADGVPSRKDSTPEAEAGSVNVNSKASDIAASIGVGHPVSSASDMTLKEAEEPTNLRPVEEPEISEITPEFSVFQSEKTGEPGDPIHGGHDVVVAQETVNDLVVSNKDIGLPELEEVHDRKEHSVGNASLLTSNPTSAESHMDELTCEMNVNTSLLTSQVPQPVVMSCSEALQDVTEDKNGSLTESGRPSLVMPSSCSLASETPHLGSARDPNSHEIDEATDTPASIMEPAQDLAVVSCSHRSPDIVEDICASVSEAAQEPSQPTNVVPSDSVSEDKSQDCDASVSVIDEPLAVMPPVPAASEDHTLEETCVRNKETSDSNWIVHPAVPIPFKEADPEDLSLNEKSITPSGHSPPGINLLEPPRDGRNTENDSSLGVSQPAASLSEGGYSAEAMHVTDEGNDISFSEDIRPVSVLPSVQSPLGVHGSEASQDDKNAENASASVPPSATDSADGASTKDENINVPTSEDTHLVSAINCVQLPTEVYLSESSHDGRGAENIQPLDASQPIAAVSCVPSPVEGYSTEAVCVEEDNAISAPEANLLDAVISSVQSPPGDHSAEASPDGKRAQGDFPSDPSRPQVDISCTTAPAETSNAEPRCREDEGININTSGAQFMGAPHDGEGAGIPSALDAPRTTVAFSFVPSPAVVESPDAQRLKHGGSVDSASGAASSASNSPPEAHSSEAPHGSKGDTADISYTSVVKDEGANLSAQSPAGDAPDCENGGEKTSALDAFESSTLSPSDHHFEKAAVFAEAEGNDASAPEATHPAAAISVIQSSPGGQTVEASHESESSLTSSTLGPAEQPIECVKDEGDDSTFSGAVIHHVLAISSARAASPEVPLDRTPEAASAMDPSQPVAAVTSPGEDEGDDAPAARLPELSSHAGYGPGGASGTDASVGVGSISAPAESLRAACVDEEGDDVPALQEERGLESSQPVVGSPGVPALPQGSSEEAVSSNAAGAPRSAAECEMTEAADNGTSKSCDPAPGSGAGETPPAPLSIHEDSEAGPGALCAEPSGTEEEDRPSAAIAGASAAESNADEPPGGADQSARAVEEEAAAAADV